MRRTFGIYLLLSITFYLCPGNYLFAGLGDSLSSELAGIKDHSERYDFAYQQAKKYLFSKPEIAKAYCKLCISGSREQNLPFKEYSCLLSLGTHFLILPDPDSAKWAYDKVIDGFPKHMDSLLVARATKNMGLVYFRSGDFQQALADYQKASKIFYKLDRPVYYANLMDIGNVFLRLEDNENARQNLWEALNYIDPEKNTRWYANTLNSYGILLENEKKYDSLAHYYRRSYVLKKKLNDIYGQSVSLNNIGNIFSRYTPNPDSAIKYYKLGIEIAEKYRLKKELAQLYLNIANAYETRKQYELAASLRDSALQIGISTKNYETQRKAIWGLAMVKGKFLGEYAEAFELLRKHRYIEDTVFNRGKLEAIEEMNAKYESAENQRRLAEVKADLRQRQFLSTLFGGISLLLALLGFLIWFRGRSLRRAAVQETKIVEQEKGLKAIIKATEEERRRIARDLHDGIGQELAALQLAFDSKGGRQDASLSLRLQEASQKLRTVSHQMMPRALELAGLEAALRELVEKSMTGTPINAQFDAFGIPKDLDKDISLVIYRVAQELLNNVLKHSSASNVDILLTHSSQKISLVIEDDGNGFKSEEIEEGLGLSNMRSRLATVNGELQFESGEDRGLRAIANIPLS
ncbi:MAG: histidine kinase [Bacteroidia bacterium]|nr:histidine kinase [Bacteroidia bacterium]